jgi:hypothetical protein
MGILDSIGRAVRLLSDERELAGVPAGARQRHRESLQLQREHEAKYESRDEYGVGVPSLGDIVSPFTWHPMRFERHLQIERATGVIDRSEEYYLASPDMLPQLQQWAEYLNAFVTSARMLAPAIPQTAVVDARLIRVSAPTHVPSIDERPSMSLFSVETTTKTGKPAKYPLRLMLITGDGRSDVSFLPDGSPGKLRIVLWTRHDGFTIDCKMTAGKLAVSFVTRMSDNTKERIYDHRV